MASHETSAQKETVERVMREFKDGELESSRGGKVKNRKQAVAIALSEAGASREQSPPENKRSLARAKAKERRGETATKKPAAKKPAATNAAARRASAGRRARGG